LSNNGNNNDNHTDDFESIRFEATELLRLQFSSKRLDTFINLAEVPVEIGEMVVVSVDRGEDLGRVVAKYNPRDPVASITGKFIRKATFTDIANYEQNRDFENKVLRFCRERISVRKQDMRLSSCEAQLDRRKIRIYFTADERMDFRGLVRDLASKFHARIEMRQIGVRDDARQKDGLGVCGQRLCCASYLSQFRSITLRDVREQDLTPNPSKVSGVCGRLKCCLHFESDFYRKARKLYPQVGSKARIGKRTGEVTSVDIFTETVTLLMDDDEERTMDIEKFHRKRKPLKKEYDSKKQSSDTPGGTETP
jgi:cell fate regulator YaaT (PSP1 superfamily)